MRSEVQAVSDLLHSAAIHLLRRARSEDGATGVGPARLSALSVAVFRGPLTVGELASAEGVRSATMSGIANGLEREGLVRRRPHQTDGRAVLIEATDEGRRVLARGRARRVDLIADRLGDLPTAELETLRRAAELLEERFAAQPWRPVER